MVASDGWAVIWNGRAGRAEDEPARVLRDAVRDLGWRSVLLEKGTNLAAVMEDLKASGCQQVIAAGGDGTVTAVGGAILDAGGGLTLGVLPLGTGNDLARSLGMPLDSMAALEALQNAAMHRIDAVRVGSAAGRTWMLNMATGGSSTVASQSTTKDEKARWKILAYLFHAYEAIKARRTFRVSWRTERDSGTLRATNIVVANGRSCGGGHAVAPDAILDDGLLEMLAIRDVGLWDVARLTVRLKAGSFPNDRDVIRRRCRELKLEGRPPFGLSTDGELVHRTPVEFAVHPRALCVLVPKDAGTEVAIYNPDASRDDASKK